MAALDIWQIPENLTFKADTLHKAIIKLHRLNAAQHHSADDWHLNMIEATKDLTNEKEQFEFLNYVSNPSGYKENAKLWDQLEDWQKNNTPKVVQKMVQPDEFDWDNMKGVKNVIGGTMYIHLKAEDNEEYEEDEKREIPDVD